MEFGLIDLAWTSPDYCDHLGHEPADGRSTSLYNSALQINKKILKIDRTTETMNHENVKSLCEVLISSTLTYGFTLILTSVSMFFCGCQQSD